MLISIIVPCYNQKNTINLLIASLENQTLTKSEFEVIISDDASTDESVEILKNYKGKLQLVPVYAKEHGGRAKARNSAIKKARGQFILFIDGDMTADPELLDQHLSHIKNSPNLVCIGKKIPSKELQDDTLSWYRITRGAHKCRVQEALPARYFETGNTSMSLEMIKRAGLFNEDYTSWGGEDVEMGYQLRKTGAIIYLIPDAITYHNHPETLEEYIDKIKKYAGTGLKILLKNHPEQAENNYFRFFVSENKFARLFMNLLFIAPCYKIIFYSARLIKNRFIAYRIYDYITYFNIYHGLKADNND